MKLCNGVGFGLVLWAVGIVLIRVAQCFIYV